jgi:hypothetical protein
MSRAITLILAVLLTACGGGGDDDMVPTPGVDCVARPELCV